MFRRQLPLCLVLTFAGLTIWVVQANAQQQSSAPEDKSRKVQREENRAFQDWPKTDVRLIITREEVDAYNKLSTDDERESFIRDFWARRDPSPDTEENEYRDEYYERIAYANEHFTSGKAGWLTDRGRIYAKWGKPSEIESHPAGGQYERSSYDGSSTTTYPFEIWFYRYLPGVGSGIEVEFVDPSGTGEYRIARNPFEKEAGPYSNTREGVNGFGDPNYRRQQDSPFYVTELLKNLENTPPVAERSSNSSITSSPIEDDNILNFEIRPYYFFQSDGNAIAAFAVQTENRDLVFKDSGGLQTARINVVGKIWTVSDRQLGAFQDVVTTTASVAELAEAKQRQSIYRKAVILPPGKYRLDVMLRDINSGARGFQQYAFIVPRLEESKLQISSIVLAAKLESLAEPAGNQFAIGRNKVVPNLSSVFQRGAPVGLYLQVYNAGIDQATLRPSIDVEYVVMKDGKVLHRQVEDWVGMSEAGRRLTLARLLDSSDLLPGRYDLQIRIRDRVTNQTLTPQTSFSVSP